ncbi:MAG: ATP-binding protein, partial [Myxococcota bacterium]
YEEDELIGQNARMLYPSQEHYEHVGSTWYEQIRNHGSGTIETHWRRKDGRDIVVLISSAPLKEGDDSNRITFAVQDITRLRQAEAQQREMEDRLAAAERREALGVLAAGVAHDLNNVIGPIALLPHMIDQVLQNARHASDADITDARKDLQVMADAARRAAHTIRDLKALGRRPTLAKAPMDLTRFIRECLAAQDVEAIRRDHPSVRLETAFELTNSPPIIEGDVALLHRALHNLVLNAAESIDGAGRVLVEAACVELRDPLVGFEAVPAGRFGLLRVSDTGQGIPDSVLHRMFEPFVTTKKQCGGQSGSGLGLSVVHSIVRDHDGYVDVERDHEGWSTVIALYFPATSERVEPAPPPEEQPLPTGSEQILVVDDEPGQRRLVRRRLQKLGYTVEEAPDGMQALELASKARTAETPFDLVLLDMILSEGFDGLTTLQKLMKLDPSLRAIIVSGHAQEERGRLAEMLGATWLGKPYDAMTLARLVRDRLDGR